MIRDYSTIETVLLGAGYTLRRVADQLPEGSALLTTTSAEKAASWRELGYPAEVLDYRDRSSVRDLLIQLPSARLLIDSVPPPFGDPDRDVLEGVRSLVSSLSDTGIERIIYLSTTGVFGVEDGSWVDENTSAEPRHPRARARLDSERLYRESGREVVALRIPAIYGPGRGIGLSLRDGSYRLVDDGTRWSNRIHVEDLVEIISRLVMGSAATLPPVLCVGDDHPARSIDVVEHYCSRFKLQRPERISLQQAIERGMYTLTSNQRISNQLIKQLLGLRLRYPSYREGAGTEFESGS